MSLALERDVAGAQLAELIANRESGELICVSDTTEVHVHLQAGRIAWATDSKHAFVFTRELQEQAAISKEQFREVLEECRRSRLPVGETLIAWGLASLEQVRSALRFQIACALRELAKIGQGQTIFLRRSQGYQTYAAALTFDARELSQELVDEFGERERETRVARGLVSEVRAAVSDVSWIEVLVDEKVVEQDPPAPKPHIPASLVKLTLLDGAEMVTFRSTRGTLVGAALGGGRTIWCRVAMDSTFGSVVSALSGLGRGDQRGSLAGAGAPDGPRWQLGDGSAALLAKLTEFAEQVEDVAAVLVAGPLGGELLHGIGIAHAAPDWCRDVVRRRAPVFDLARDVLAELQPSHRPDLEGMGFRLQSLATAEGDFWCFGTELGIPQASSAWLFLERKASQGLGWAYLSALGRRLESLQDWGVSR